jgi:2-C-methyl-D-erythritol 4-phosphate cytidylyltransferase
VIVAAVRPEVLGAAADALSFDFALLAADVSSRFAQAVESQIAASTGETLRVLHSLTPLQSAVLRVLTVAGLDYAPFEAETLARYQKVLDAIAPNAQVAADVSNVQQALSALQEKSLVWRAARGVYALEDGSLAEVMADNRFLDAVPTMG